MKLHKNSLKLAGLYLAIIMFISLFFSAAIFQLSVAELDRGLRHPGPMGQLGPEARLPADIRDVLRQDREIRYTEAKDRVAGRLIAVNGIIFIAAGFLSYYLSLRTLRPIEEANERLERFTADASHELRTPLSVMQSEIDVALTDPKLSLAKARAVLSSNLEEITRLTDLSAALLQLARLGGDSLPKQELGLSAVVQKAVEEITPLASQKDIKIMVPVMDEGVVMGDEPSLFQAIAILLDNAVKYSPKKSKIDVQVEATPKNIIIKVADRGPGIKDSELPHIFERFYRADSSRSRAHTNGYGLGLAIAQSIVGMHNGSISVESSYGKGSTFTIQLPRAK